MSSTTKKAKISEEDKKRVESLKKTTDLYKDYDAYLREVNNRTGRKKKEFAEEIEQMGEQFVQEIEEKKIKKEIQKEENISFIFRNAGDRYGNKEKLRSMTDEEINSIYIKIGESKKSWFARIIDFIMSW